MKLGQKYIKNLVGFLGALKISKFHSEINWLLAFSFAIVAKYSKVCSTKNTKFSGMFSNLFFDVINLRRQMKCIFLTRLNGILNQRELQIKHHRKWLRSTRMNNFRSLCHRTSFPTPWNSSINSDFKRLLILLCHFWKNISGWHDEITNCQTFNILL